MAFSQGRDQIRPRLGKGRYTMSAGEEKSNFVTLVDGYGTYDIVLNHNLPLAARILGARRATSAELVAGLP